MEVCWRRAFQPRSQGSAAEGLLLLRDPQSRVAPCRAPTEATWSRVLAHLGLPLWEWPGGCLDLPRVSAPNLGGGGQAAHPGAAPPPTPRGTPKAPWPWPPHVLVSPTRDDWFRTKGGYRLEGQHDGGLGDKGHVMPLEREGLLLPLPRGRCAEVLLGRLAARGPRPSPFPRRMQCPLPATPVLGSGALTTLATSTSAWPLPGL